MRQLPVHQVLGHPLVDALVTAAQQREPLAVGQLPGHRLVEAPTSRAQQVQRPDRGRGLYRSKDGLGRQHHARSPAEGAVVDAAVRVGRARAQVVDDDVERTAPPRLADEARPAPGRHQVGEDRKDLGAHRRNWNGSQLEQAGRDLDGETAGRRGDNEPQGDQGSAVQNEQVTGRVGLDRHHRSPRLARRSRPRGRRSARERRTRPPPLPSARLAGTEPASLSAASRLSMPAKRTSQRPPVGPVGPGTGCELSTTSWRPAHSRALPGARRSSRVVTSATTTSPCRPWGLATRPTSSSTAVSPLYRQRPLHRPGLRRPG